MNGSIVANPTPSILEGVGLFFCLKGAVKMKWFTDVRTVEELRKQYRQLMKKHHPDVGGSTEDAKEINAEYV